MKKIIILIFLLACISVSGQNHFLGVRLGSNFSTVQSSTDILKDAETKTGFVGGITYEYHLLKFIRLEADLIYTQKGYKLPVSFTNEVGIVIGEGYLIAHNDYISLPLKAGVSFGSLLSFFANIGVAPSLLTKAMYKSDFEVEGEFDHDVSDRVKDFDISGLAELGVGLNFGRFNVFINASYEHSFTDYPDDDYYGDTELRNTGFGVSAGCRYALKSRQ